MTDYYHPNIAVKAIAVKAIAVKASEYVQTNKSINTIGLFTHAACDGRVIH